MHLNAHLSPCLHHLHKPGQRGLTVRLIWQGTILGMFYMNLEVDILCRMDRKSVIEGQRLLIPAYSTFHLHPSSLDYSQ